MFLFFGHFSLNVLIKYVLNEKKVWGVDDEEGKGGKEEGGTYPTFCAAKLFPVLLTSGLERHETGLTHTQTEKHVAEWTCGWKQIKGTQQSLELWIPSQRRRLPGGG